MTSNDQPLTSTSAERLAARQIDLDTAAARRFPALAAVKRDKMLASPHGLLRGSAPLFYELLAARPELAEGPSDVGLIVGDMHVENVGAYRTDDDRVAFDLNDFDDAATAPLHLDVLRLATSILLAAHALSAAIAVELAEQMLDAYAAQIAARGEGPGEPRPSVVEAMIEKASRRSRRDLLDARAPLVAGVRHFVRGSRYLELPPELASAVPSLWLEYLGALGPRAPSHGREMTIFDAAQRVAGNGSLGRVRIALLVGREGEPHMFELKESQASAVDALVPPPSGVAHPAARVVAAARALDAEPTRRLAAIEHRDTNLSLFGRKLAPQEDKVDWMAAATGKKPASLARLTGHLLASAHVRAAETCPAPWTASALSSILDRAIEIAGIHEAVHLAYARLVKGDEAPHGSGKERRA